MPEPNNSENDSPIVNECGDIKMPDNPVIDEYGTKRWYNDKNQMHRTDGPAVIWLSGSKWWYRNGKYHRTDGPAIIWKSGSEDWFVNGKRIKPIPDIICVLRRKLKDAKKSKN